MLAHDLALNMITCSEHANQQTLFVDITLENISENITAFQEISTFLCSSIWPGIFITVKLVFCSRQTALFGFKELYLYLIRSKHTVRS